MVSSYFSLFGGTFFFVSVLFFSRAPSGGPLILKKKTVASCACGAGVQLRIGVLIDRRGRRLGPVSESTDLTAHAYLRLVQLACTEVSRPSKKHIGSFVPLVLVRSNRSSEALPPHHRRRSHAGELPHRIDGGFQSPGLRFPHLLSSRFGSGPCRLALFSLPWSSVVSSIAGLHFPAELGPQPESRGKWLSHAHVQIAVGSGGNRVWTRPPCLAASRSPTMMSRMKLEGAFGASTVVVLMLRLSFGRTRAPARCVGG
jgi:hypothetical protein